MFSRCKYMYLEIKLLTHYYSFCEFTMHNSVSEFDAKPSLVVSTLHSFGFSINESVSSFFI